MRVSVLCLVASLGCAGSRASHDAPPAAEPKPKLENEKPQGVTVDYDLLLGAWVDGKVMPEGIKG